jgi:hypothetical protein
MNTETPKTFFHDIATDEIIERELTAEEIEQIRETFPNAFTEGDTTEE